MNNEEQKPLALGYRMPAEWEPHAATWLSWPRREGISFPDSFDPVLPTLRAMVEALIESENVCINVCNGAHEAEARQVLRGLSIERITFHRIPTNEPWCRDHGPIFLTRKKEPRLAIVDWITTRGEINIRPSISMKSSPRAWRRFSMFRCFTRA